MAGGGGLGNGGPVPYSSSRGAGGMAGGPLGAAAGDPGRPVLQGVLRVGPQHREVLAQVASADDLVLTPNGLNTLPGSATAGLGACRLDTILRLAPAPPPIGPPGTGPRAPAHIGPYLTPAALSCGGGGGGGMSSSRHLTLAVGSLELSLIDGRPEEVAVLTVDGLTAELTTGRSAGVDFFHLGLRVKSVQLDDQVPGSAYPVVLQPLEHHGAAAAAGGGGPLFVLEYCCQPGKLRHALNCPVIAARLLPLRLSMGEPLLWRLYGMANAVTAAGPGAGGANAPGGAHQQVAGSDLPLAIELMAVEDVATRLSFRSDPSSRPRWANVGVLQLGLDLAQLEDLALELPGIQLERVRLPRSELLKKLFDRMQERVFSITLAVLRSAGIVGGLSKVLAVSSAGVAQLAKDGGGGARAGAAGAAGAGAGGARGGGGAEVRDLPSGVMEGGRLIARGFLKGAAGIITKPVEGAEQGGVTGFFGGLAKGIVGAAVQPVSGALAAVGKVTEGVDAARRNITGAVTGTTGARRRRLQRAFTGDNVLRPFSLHPALGQALLYSVASWLSPGARAGQGGGGGPLDRGGTLSGLGSALSGLSLGALPSSRPAAGGVEAARAGGGGRPDLRRDRYEEHWVLPRNVVLLVTDRRVLAMQAPEFVALQSAVLSGEVTHVTDVPYGDAVVMWQLSWPEMLSAELAWVTKTPQQQPHWLGGVPGVGPAGATAAAAALAGAAPAGGGGAAIPADGLLLHRKRRSEDDQLLYEVCCIPGTSQASEILSRLQEVRYRCYLLPRQQERGWSWRPGDTPNTTTATTAATSTTAPAAGPGRPGQQAQQPTSAAGATAVGLGLGVGAVGSSPGGGGAVILPDTMPSQEFQLVWAATGSRASGGRSASIWRPVGPPGYMALGDVAITGRESPPRPVRMYKDAPALAAAAVNASGSSDAPASELPRLAPPVGYTLVFRDSANPPITIWRPVPPRGYVELGCVAWPEIEEPPLGLSRCLRRDLVAPGRVFDSPVWSGASSDNAYWRCSLWPVDCPALTFVGVKGDGKPPPYMLREPVF